VGALSVARIPLPKKVQTSNREVNELQDAIGETLRRIAYHQQLTGQWIQTVSVPATGVDVAHGLGRVPIGWQLTDILDGGTVYRTSWDNRTITLRSVSGTVRVDLYVW
jgi:hypothetical protein